MGCCTLSRKEIAERAGIGKHPQALYSILRNLEKAGTIVRDEKNRIYFILPIPDDYDSSKDLIIPREIFHNPKLNMPQKVVASVVGITCVEEKNWRWWCRKIGMSEQSFKWNLRQIVLRLHPDPYRVLYGRPIEFYKRPYRVLEALSIGSTEEGIEALSKDKAKGPAAHSAVQTPSGQRNDPPTLKGGNMAPGTQQLPTRLLPARSIRPETKKEQNYKRSIELEKEVLSLPHLAKQVFGKKSYAESAAAVWHLSRGMATQMPKGKLRLIEAKMLQCGLSKDQIGNFLNKKFNPDERRELYKLLDNYHDPLYEPLAKNGAKNLAGALLNEGTGYCLLMQLYYHPPKLKNIGPPTPKITPDLEIPVSHLKEFLPKQEITFQTVNQLREMKLYHEQVIVPRLRKNGSGKCIKFTQWLWALLTWTAREHEDKFHPGYLVPKARNFKEFEEDFFEDFRF